MKACGGVLVPAFRKKSGRVVYWRRVCFVDERDNRAKLSKLGYKDGRQPLQFTSDHYFPTSRWPDSTRLHTAHLYCQLIQGKRLGYQTRLGSKLTDETKAKMSIAGKAWARTAAGKSAKARAGLAAIASRIASGQFQSESHLAHATPNLNKGRCFRWNIKRHKPCVCGQHKEEQ